MEWTQETRKRLTAYLPVGGSALARDLTAVLAEIDRLTQTLLAIQRATYETGSLDSIDRICELVEAALAHTPNSAENAENRIRGEYQRDELVEAKDRLTRCCDWCDSPDSMGQNADYGHALIWDDAPGDTIREDDIRTVLAALDRSVAGVIPSRGNEVKK